jgi:hypothetical protein
VEGRAERLESDGGRSEGGGLAEASTNAIKVVRAVVVERHPSHPIISNLTKDHKNHKSRPE